MVRDTPNGAGPPPRPTSNRSFDSLSSRSSWQGAARTLANMAPTAEQNAYIQYNAKDTFDDVEIDYMEPVRNGHTEEPRGSNGYKDQGSAGHYYNSKPRNVTETPDGATIFFEYEKYMEAMYPMSEDEIGRQRKIPDDGKWDIISRQKGFAPSHSVKEYIDNLKVFVSHQEDPGRRAADRKKSMREPNSMTLWLKRLKLELLLSQPSFAEEFTQQFDGLHLLVNLLYEIRREGAVLQNQKKSKLNEVSKQNKLDEYACLICIKFALNSDKDRQLLIRQKAGVSVVAHCIYSDNRRCQIAAFEILESVCSDYEGFKQVENALQKASLASGEKQPYYNICIEIPVGGPFYQLACIRFFNAIQNNIFRGNKKIAFQLQLEEAGFDPDAIDRYGLQGGHEWDVLQKELDKYRKQYLDIDETKPQIMDLETRCKQLREEIDRLNKTKEEDAKSAEQYRKQVREAEEKAEEFREQASRLQDLVNKVNRLYEEKTGEMADEYLNTDRAYQPLELDFPEPDYGMGDSEGSMGSMDDLTSTEMNIKPRAPAPPALPPMNLSRTVKQKLVASHNLPLLHWTPLDDSRKVEGTFFKDIDDEAKLKEINFKEFEETFKLKIKEESAESRIRRERAMDRVNDKITFVAPKKAQIIVITLKKTKRSPFEIRQAVDALDLTILEGELAELILKFTPTKDELKQLVQHKDNYNHLGEAEQFLYHLGLVDRLESKLGIMAFMGKFTEIVEHVNKPIESIYDTSESVTQCVRFKRILEIILAFGNYMNMNKKGYALGFKLESLKKLEDVKSTDRSLTLLNYIVEYIERHYPDLTRWYDDIDISVEKGESYQAVASDVLGLRRGLDLLKFERERGVTEEVNNFYAYASDKVAEVAEKFHQMEQSYIQVCQSFGEKYKQIEPDEFFKLVTDFIDAFKKTELENDRRLHPEKYETPITPLIATPRKSPRGPEPKETPPPWVRKHSQDPKTAFPFKPVTNRDSDGNRSSGPNHYEATYDDVMLHKDAPNSNMYEGLQTDGEKKKTSDLKAHSFIYPAPQSGDKGSLKKRKAPEPPAVSHPDHPNNPNKTGRQLPRIPDDLDDNTYQEAMRKASESHHMEHHPPKPVAQEAESMTEDTETPSSDTSSDISAQRSTSLDTIDTSEPLETTQASMYELESAVGYDEPPARANEPPKHVVIGLQAPTPQSEVTKVTPQERAPMSEETPMDEPEYEEPPKRIKNVGKAKKAKAPEPKPEKSAEIKYVDYEPEPFSGYDEPPRKAKGSPKDMAPVPENDPLEGTSAARKYSARPPKKSKAPPPPVTTDEPLYEEPPRRAKKGEQTPASDDTPYSTKFPGKLSVVSEEDSNYETALPVTQSENDRQAVDDALAFLDDALVEDSDQKHRESISRL